MWQKTIPGYYWLLNNFDKQIGVITPLIRYELLHSEMLQASNMVENISTNNTIFDLCAVVLSMCAVPSKLTLIFGIYPIPANGRLLNTITNTRTLRWGAPNMRRPVYVSIVVVDALVPNRYQAISSHHADITVTIALYESYHVSTYHVTIN